GPTKQGATRPFGIDKRLPLTTSTVVGSPDPPRPYRVKRVYPDLKAEYPIIVRHQPGSDRLLFISENRSYGPTQICRMKDEPNAAAFETLLKNNGTAYDIAFHPDFARNGCVYVGWNGPEKGRDKKTRITRYTMDRTPPYALDLKSEKLIIEWPSNGH